MPSRYGGLGRFAVGIAGVAAIALAGSAAGIGEAQTPHTAARPAAAAGGPQPARHAFVTRGAGRTFPRDLVTTEAKLTSKQTDGRYSFLDEIWNPGFVVSPHFHTEHSETFYIVSGQVEWTVGGETRVMTTGDAVYIPSDTVHSVKVVGKQDVHTLMVYEPAGYEYHMIDEAKYTPAQRQDPKVIQLLRSQYDYNPAPAATRSPGAASAASAGTTTPAPSRQAQIRQIAAQPSPSQHHFAMRGKGETFRPELEISEVKLTSIQTDGRYSFLDEIWKPGMSVPPHYHTEHSETFYIVKGQVEWTVGGETQVLGPGGLVFIPPDTVHSVKVVGKEDLQSLMIYEPGGYEYHARREATYTPAQQKDPQILNMLREMHDFNPVAR